MLSNEVISQDMQLGFFMKGNQLDKGEVLENLDNSYDWDSGFVNGLTTLGLEYKTNAKKNKSIKTSLGYSATAMAYQFNNDQLRVVHGYTSSYLNFRILALYHFKTDNRGLKIGLGPSVSALISHKQTQNENFTITEVPSALENRFSKTPLYLDIEVSYALKFFNLFNRQFYFEFGYSPQVKINGYINGNSKNFIMPRGLRLSLNSNLNSTTPTSQPKTPPH